MNLENLKSVKIGFERDVALLHDASGLLPRLRLLAGEYLKARIDWANSAPDQRIELDATRTRAHDAFISVLDAFTRRASGKGATLEWRRALARNGDAEERKNVGDFACYIAFELAIRAR